jgi:hypothetical protein
MYRAAKLNSVVLRELSILTVNPKVFDIDVYAHSIQKGKWCTGLYVMQ